MATFLGSPRALTNTDLKDCAVEMNLRRDRVALNLIRMQSGR